MVMYGVEILIKNNVEALPVFSTSCKLARKKALNFLKREGIDGQIVKVSRGIVV